jgi:hypothetical protein
MLPSIHDLFAQDSPDPVLWLNEEQLDHCFRFCTHVPFKPDDPDSDLSRLELHANEIVFTNDFGLMVFELHFYPALNWGGDTPLARTRFAFPRNVYADGLEVTSLLQNLGAYINRRPRTSPKLEVLFLTTDPAASHFQETCAKAGAAGYQTYAFRGSVDDFVALHPEHKAHEHPRDPLFWPKDKQLLDADCKAEFDKVMEAEAYTQSALVKRYFQMSADFFDWQWTYLHAWLLETNKRNIMSWPDLNDDKDWPHCTMTQTYLEAPLPASVLRDNTVFLGGLCNVRGCVLDALGIGAVLAVGAVETLPYLRKLRPHIVVEGYEIHDRCLHSAQTILASAVQFIRDQRAAGRRVLVHCHMGMSRSVTIVVAFLISEFKLALQEAFLMVEAMRREVRINARFWNNLRAWEFQELQQRATHTAPASSLFWG